MTRYIGHREVVTALTRELPPVTLLSGPTSIGKWTLAQHLAARHQVAKADRALYPDGLTIGAVRKIIHFVATAGSGPFKLVGARLDGSTEPALNALLKTLEEPPGSTRFLLTSSRPTLDTVTSRCAVFRMGLLQPAELRQILLDHGLSAKAADRAAALGRGQVRPALSVDTTDLARNTVLAVVRALATGDKALFDKAFSHFDESARDLLLAWITETISGRWHLFSPADTFGLAEDLSRIRRMLVALSRVHDARPRLGVRAALEPFVAG